MSNLSKEIESTAERLAGEILTSINLMGYEDDFTKGFIKGIDRGHRTLQQAFGRVVCELIKHYAELDLTGQHDLRNDAWCRLCSKLAPIVKEHSCLPFI